MAIYSNLDVYKECYDLLHLLFTATPNIKREYRFTLAEGVKKDLVELCVIIYRANKNEDLDCRIAHIEEAREMLVRVMIQCRILSDMKQISIKLFSLISQHNISIQKQLDAWYKYTSAKRIKADAKG